MRILLLICFLAAASVIVKAQKDSVRLVDIQSSECGGSYYVKPYFLSKETIGDTTYISLSCTNNCGGYYDPSVNLYGDSVAIRVRPGTKDTAYLINREYIGEEELEELGLETYMDSTHLKRERHSMASCDCCYTFKLKVIGLSVSANYRYFYNGSFVDPDYKGPPIRIHLDEHFLNKPGSIIFKKTKRIIESEKLMELVKENDLFIYLTMDTLICSFKEVIAEFGAKDKRTQSAERKLAKYFRSLSPSCILDPNKNQIIDQFLIRIEYLWGDWGIRYLPKEDIYKVGL